MRIKDFVEIKPYETEEDFAEQIWCLSSLKDAPDHYVATYKNAEDKLCAVHFEATQKTLKILKFYNSETKVTETRY